MFCVNMPLIKLDTELHFGHKNQFRVHSISYNPNDKLRCLEICYFVPNTNPVERPISTSEDNFKDD